MIAQRAIGVEPAGRILHVTLEQRSPGHVPSDEIGRHAALGADDSIGPDDPGIAIESGIDRAVEARKIARIQRRDDDPAE